MQLSGWEVLSNKIQLQMAAHPDDFDSDCDECPTSSSSSSRLVGEDEEDDHEEEENSKKDR